MPNFILEIVKLKGKGWALRAEMDAEKRYRVFYYKAVANSQLKYWEGILKANFYREFYHNFNSAEELGITLTKV